MLQSNNKPGELQNLLDSDDELPIGYNEEPEPPAYLDDRRFDAIKFSWIKKDNARSIPAEQHTGPASTQPPSEITDKNLIKKGILNEQDILCMKSVAARADDDQTLLWFIDFLMYKDLQSDYKFLKSCLVYSHEKYKHSRKYSQIFYPKSLSNGYDVVVK